VIRVRVTKNEFSRVAQQVPVRANAAVVETSLEVSAEAKVNSRVKTGTMRRGWYTRHQGLFRSRVANPVPYAPHHEFGTHKMAAQPMVTPAIEHARPRFLARLRSIFDG